MYYCLPKSSFLPPNLLLEEFISWYGKDKHEVLNLKTDTERISFSYKIQSFGKAISFKYLCPMAYGHEDWPTITRGNNKAGGPLGSSLSDSSLGDGEGGEGGHDMEPVVPGA